MNGTGGYYNRRRMGRLAAFRWWLRQQASLLGRCWPYLLLAFALGVAALVPIYNVRIDSTWDTCDMYAELHRAAAVRARDCQMDLRACREGRR